jgi:hypothetical protein
MMLAASCDCSREGDSTFSEKRIGSPYCTVTFGKRSRFQLRAASEPWIAAGTITAPVSSASRPMPGFASPRSPVRERPPSAYITITPPRERTVCAVLNISSSRCPRRTGNTPPWL